MLNDHENTRQFEFVNFQIMKRCMKTIRNGIFHLLNGLSLLIMVCLFKLSLLLILKGTLDVVGTIEKFQKSTFTIVFMKHIIITISGILGLWICTYAKRWRKSAKEHWKNQLFFPAFSLILFSTFPIIVLFYLPFRSRICFKLSGY